MTGAVTSSSGNFNIGSGANLTASSGVNVTGGTISATDATSKLTGSLNYTSSSNSTFQGVIAGAATTVTMNNPGATLTLSNANTYSGATNVTAGTLTLTGSTAAASTVNVGTAGTLNGTGTVNGNATLTGNGIIAFGTGGNIAGTLGVTGGNWNGVGTVAGAVISSSGNFNLGSGANLTASSGMNVTGGTISATDGTAMLTGNFLNYTSASNSTSSARIGGGKHGNGEQPRGDPGAIRGQLLYRGDDDQCGDAPDWRWRHRRVHHRAIGPRAGQCDRDVGARSERPVRNIHQCSFPQRNQRGLSMRFNPALTPSPGLISGSGVLNQNGSGTTILTHAETYTGTTTINAGTLQIGDGATTGVIDWCHIGPRAGQWD